jgi:exosortase/archaeosortase family protein
LALKKKEIKKKNSKKDFASKAKNYFSEQEELIKSDQKKQFVFFILGFILCYLVITAIISFIPAMFFEQTTGQAVQILLSAQGMNSDSIGAIKCTEFSYLGETTESQCYSFNIGEKQIVISWLCAGVLEIVILISAIFASFGINNKKKLIGAFVAIILGVVFNLLRVWVTVNIILTQEVGTVEIAHDLLFRVILFVYIVIVYVIWFNWAEKSK